ncbi:MAG: FkbM family methyltransferase, partial [Eubacterium sp.]|nr:FkbM family methyltransferase [Eubacterium sp.]
LQLENVNFLFDSEDNLIPNEMLGYGKIYSKDEMIFLYEMAPRIEKGYFLDIGANVGTTSIYFRKRICDSLNYIAFEPLKVNYKYLKMNCILNDCEDIKVENIGMSNVNGQKKMYLIKGAHGSSMVSDTEEEIESCDFMTLDSYMSLNHLLAKDIGYIWADVQCHELELLEGAQRTLTDSQASLFIEFNIDVLQKEGKCEKFIEMLQDIYAKFICYEQYVNGRKEVRSIMELFKLTKEINMPFCNILLMK